MRRKNVLHRGNSIERYAVWLSKYCMISLICCAFVRQSDWLLSCVWENHNYRANSNQFCARIESISPIVIQRFAGWLRCMAREIVRHTLFVHWFASRSLGWAGYFQWIPPSSVAVYAGDWRLIAFYCISYDAWPDRVRALSPAIVTVFNTFQCPRRVVAATFLLVAIFSQLWHRTDLWLISVCQSKQSKQSALAFHTTKAAFDYCMNSKCA